MGARVETGNGGLERVVLDAAEIYLLGATVTRWAPPGHEPVLFTSREASFRLGSAIRGGVPLCFPWFGPHPGDASAPQHGRVRTALWSVVELGQAHATLGLELAPFELRHRVEAGDKLELSFTVTNRGAEPARFEGLLHAYFKVSDVRQVSVRGLEDAGFVDKVKSGLRSPPAREPLSLTAETDRIYPGVRGGAELVDPGLGRKITLQTDGCRSLVVWNPWREKAAKLGDLADDEWPEMVCLEPGSVGEDAITLAPAASHSLRLRVVVNRA